MNLLAKMPPADLVSLDPAELLKLVKSNERIQAIAKAIRVGAVTVGDGGVATMLGGSILMTDLM